MRRGSEASGSQRTSGIREGRINKVCLGKQSGLGCQDITLSGRASVSHLGTLQHKRTGFTYLALGMKPTMSII